MRLVAGLELYSMVLEDLMDQFGATEADCMKFFITHSENDCLGELGRRLTLNADC